MSVQNRIRKSIQFFFLSRKVLFTDSETILLWGNTIWDCIRDLVNSIFRSAESTSEQMSHPSVCKKQKLSLFIKIRLRVGYLAYRNGNCSFMKWITVGKVFNINESESKLKISGVMCWTETLSAVRYFCSSGGDLTGFRWKREGIGTIRKYLIPKSHNIRGEFNAPGINVTLLD